MSGSSHVALLHILISGPLLMYIGLFKPQYKWLYYLLFLTGIGLCLKFLFMVFTQPLSQRYVWFVIHLALFAPLLIYVGIKQEATPNIAYSLLLAIGIAAFGYHFIRYLQSFQKSPS